MNDLRFSVISLSGIYSYEGFHLQREGLRFIDCTDVRGTNGYCDERSGEILRERLFSAATPGETVCSGLHFIDHGNYHYLSSFFTDAVGYPFQLLVADHHTDLQQSAFGDLLSCGSWIRHVLAHNENALRVVVAGPPAQAVRELKEHAETDTVLHDALSSARLRVLSEEAFDSVSLEKALSDTLPLYLSLDKDILSRDDVCTNWDQGSLHPDTLLDVLQALCGRHTLIGMDVCGDAAPDMDDALLSRAIAQNDALNARFLAAFGNISGGISGGMEKRS